MKKIIFILFFLISLNADAQIHRDAVWCFGDSALIDFNQTPPRLDYCAIRSRGSACSIADSTGALLFYTQTDYIPLWLSGYLKLGIVWNKNNQIMENGDSLIGDGWYKEMIIIPVPNNPYQYYLFHTDVTIYRKIYFSIVDLSYNNGLGKVIQRNVEMDTLNGNSVTDGITAIKHGNGRDWWLIFRTYDATGSHINSFYKFLITPSGISNSIIQNIGHPTSAGILNLTFNQKGNQLVLIDALGLIELYDFDRCSGMLSNLKTIHSETSILADNFWAAEFSPNDSLLYVTTSQPTISFLYQFNLFASSIPNAKITISTDSFPPYSGTLKLAADGKIYRANAFANGGSLFPYSDTTYNQYNMNLSVINHPNVLGLGCDFQPYSFYLGGRRTYWGLPNNPNYDMPALGGSICDTLGLPNGIVENENHTVEFYPNPTSDKFEILSENNFSGKLSIQISDFLGRTILKKELESNIVDVHAIPNGTYSISFYSNNEFLN